MSEYTQECSIDLPVVDISQFPQDLDGIQLENVQDHPLLTTVREACKEFGIFRLINHGISADFLEKVQSVSRQLLSMPTNVKEGGYCCVYLPCSDSVKEIAEKIWPERNSNACETIQTYFSCLSDLSQKIIKMILVSLGLDANKFYESDFRHRKINSLINHFASLGQAVGEEAMDAHTDIDIFTILYQDDAGGLQIRSKQGNWMSVEPLPQSFIINIGDCLKAWSNGWYHSPEHRVVRNGWTDRMSIAIFVHFLDEKEIWAPAELVDAENPRRYKPFYYSDFKRAFFKNMEDKNKNLCMVIDQFAGV